MQTPILKKIETYLLIHGLFAVFCQLIFLLFYTLIAGDLPIYLITPRQLLHYLEYPLMSTTLLLGSGLLIRYISKKEEHPER